jgi:flagellin
MMAESPEKAQELARGVSGGLAIERGTIGARLTTIESELKVQGEQLIQLTGAQSLIEDTDYAAEISNLVRAQVLGQAQIATMAIGRQTAGSVVALLENVRGAAGR